MAIQTVPRRILSLLWLSVSLGAQVAPQTASEGPFKAPPEMVNWLRPHIRLHMGQRAVLQSILTSTFDTDPERGLGMVYDNSRTRTVAEVWKERKANCLSLTAFYVEAANHAGINAKYAEALNTNRWRKTGGNIRLERHVVALVEMGGNGDVVADFLPQARRRMGSYSVRILSPQRFLALFHCNRAVESMDAEDYAEAGRRCEEAMKADPLLATVWNTRGVLQMKEGRMAEAEADFRKALEMEQRDYVALGNLEQLCRLLGREEEAARLREQSLKLRQRDPYFQAFLAEEALQAQDLPEALRRIKLAIKIQKEDPEFYLLRARIEMEAGDLDEAGKALKEAQRFASPEEKARFENKSEALKRQQEKTPK